MCERMSKSWDRSVQEGWVCDRWAKKADSIIRVEEVKDER
jgi:hypothetical protein